MKIKTRIPANYDTRMKQILADQGYDGKVELFIYSERPADQPTRINNLIGVDFLDVEDGTDYEEFMTFLALRGINNPITLCNNLLKIIPAGKKVVG